MGIHYFQLCVSVCLFIGVEILRNLCPPVQIYWWLVELPKRFTTATHKSVSLFWWTFFGTFWECRKVTPRCFKHLCVPTLKCWNEPKRRGRETEPTEKLNQQKICISHFVLLSAERSFQFFECQNIGVGHYENGKYGRSSPKMRPRAKLPITDPPKVWVSGFLSVDGNAKLVLAIMENGKNGCSSPKTCPKAKLPITDPPKVWVSVFLSVDGNAKMCPRAKLPITDPPKVWVSGFLSVNGNAKLVSADKLWTLEWIF